jgi:pyruvate,water dikinase
MQLAAHPKLLTRFDAILDVAQRYVSIREEIVNDFTLGWPVMRLGLRQLGAWLTERGSIRHADEIFWLTRSEIAEEVAGMGADHRDAIAERQRMWQRRNRLDAPDHIGKPNKRVVRFRALFDSPDAAPHTTALLVGAAASAGTATGPVRVVSSPADFDQVEPGDVLVTRATTPAWTPLFARVAAVVTDVGSPLAHASLIAREYGIPAVVGTRNGTRLLHNGQLVTVDGSTGRVFAMGKDSDRDEGESSWPARARG